MSNVDNNYVNNVNVLYKYNMVLREVVKITGPEVLDAWDYFPTRSGGK